MALRQRRTRAPRQFRLLKPQWVDPFPGIPGTEPEKRIFEVLVRRRIFFVFQGQVQELLRGLYVTMAIPGYKPDFIIPEYKVIIDPYSPFHHSLPGAAERDREKNALYSALGYTYYYPWAIAPGEFLLDMRPLRVVNGKPRLGKQILRTGGAEDVINAIPELYGPKRGTLTDKQKRLAQHPGYELGPFLGAGANSVAAANRARARTPKLTLQSGTRRRIRRTRRL